MRVGSLQNYRVQKLTFGNILPEEKQEFLKVKQEALNVLGQPDKSVFIYSSACLPQSPDRNTGTGTFLTKQGDEFLDVIKTYTTANIVQDLPSGELIEKPIDGFYCAYEASAFSPAQNLIEPEILMDEKFGKLINEDELKAVVAANNGEKKDVLANFENVVETDSPFNNMLKKAYERLTTGDSQEVKKLREEFSQYKAKNAEWLEPHAIFDVLSKKYKTPLFDKWSDELDGKLYDTDVDEAARKERIGVVLKENANDIEFYNFKKFMADKCLGLAREKANEKGLKFGCDVQYAFNLSDVFSSPKAFLYDVYMGPREFEFPALNFHEITNPDSPAAKLLKQKITRAAQRYDTLRIDIGWGYVTPMLSNTSGSYKEHKEMGSNVLELIENTVKEVKGDKFNPKDIFYEVEASAEDFRAFNDDGSVIEPLRGRVKIYSSEYMSDGWGSVGAYNGRFKLSPDEYIYGASNRDTTPLYELAASEKKPQQVKVLAGALNISEDTLKDSGEFIRAKQAEPLLAKNQFMFFTEFFGMKRKFNFHKINGEGFRVKMPSNPEKAYFDALKEGRGFNIMDAFEKLFISKGLDKKHPELYAKVVEFKNKLYGIKPKEVIEAGQEEAKAAASTTETSKPVTEAVEKTAKKGKYAKPILITAGVLAGLFGIYELFCKKPKAED